jgi:hypothetical protein
MAGQGETFHNIFERIFFKKKKMVASPISIDTQSLVDVIFLVLHLSR